MSAKTWLNDLGWPYQDKAMPQSQDAFLIGRILRQDRQYFTVETYTGSKRARLPGKARNRTSSKADLPAVGDWIGIKMSMDPDGLAEIVYQYPRKSSLCRQATGDVKDKQVLAANIDLVFVISGLDQNFNVNRIERFLMMAWSSGLPAVLLLNKADLFPNPVAQLSALEPILSGTPVHPISALRGTAIDTVTSYLGTGKSAALVGSSGVGKSTLVNHLMEEIHNFQLNNRGVSQALDKGQYQNNKQCFERHFYVYDINAIIADPLKNKTESEMTGVYTKRVEYLKKRGYASKYHGHISSRKKNK